MKQVAVGQDQGYQTFLVKLQKIDQTLTYDNCIYQVAAADLELDHWTYKLGIVLLGRYGSDKSVL